MNACPTLPETGEAISKALVSRDFGRAAEAYDNVAVVQRDIGHRLMAWGVAPHASGAVKDILDLGCGTGYFLPHLQQAFPQGQLVAVDIAPSMIRYAQEHRDVRVRWLVADAEQMPLADASLDLIFSSLAVQWCDDLPRVIREANRVLRPGGRFVFSTLLDGTLHEMREAWAVADPDHRHVNHFLSVSAVAAAIAPSWTAQCIDQQAVVVKFQTVTEVLRHLKALGASLKSADRSRGMMGKGRLRAFEGAYDTFRLADGSLPATYQVLNVSLQKR